MEHTLKVRLMATQMRALQEHTEMWNKRHPKDERTPEEDLIAVWWGRMCALADYTEKLDTRGAKFRAYAPRNLDDGQREKIKAEAVKEGIAPKPGKNGTAHPKVKKPAKAKAHKQPRLPGV